MTDLGASLIWGAYFLPLMIPIVPAMKGSCKIGVGRVD